MENAHIKQNQDTQVFNIPEITSYKEGSQPIDVPKNGDELVYEPVIGEKVLVTFWCRYPNYDFIFGVPDKSSPKYEKEISFVQFRDTREKKVKMGMYLDVEETQEMIAGMKKCLKVSKKNSPHIWKNLKVK